MLGHALIALMALSLTDRTVEVQKGTRLDITDFSGEVAIKVWDRDAVRVEVQHSDRETVDIQAGDQRLAIRARSTTGIPRRLDYVISVPAWMAIAVTGTSTDVTMEGVGGDVSVETTRGAISVNGGSGFVSLKSVQGEIVLQKAKGRIDITGVNEGIQIADVSGDVSAETINGSIVLDRIESASVDLYTVHGNISYDGAIRDKGTYRLTTHNGAIGLVVSERTNATLSVRTYSGGFRSSFPVKLDDQDTKRRFAVTLGNGSARVQLESFNGTIALRRPGDPDPETVRRRRERILRLKH